MREILTIIALASLSLTACTDKEGAIRAIENEGMHTISVGGYAWFSCEKSDNYRTKFKAYSSDSSRIVTGCVCAGVLKGSTIRFD